MQGRRHAAFNLCAVGDAAGGELVDLHLGAVGRSARADDHDVALRERVDLPVRAAQGRDDECAAAQRFGVAHRGHIDVDLLARLGEGGQLRRHHHGGDIARLHGDTRRQDHAKALQHGGQALLGERRLRGLIAGAVEAHHQPIAGQRIAAHTRHGRHFLDAGGVGFLVKSYGDTSHCDQQEDAQALQQGFWGDQHVGRGGGLLSTDSEDS